MLDSAYIIWSSKNVWRWQLTLTIDVDVDFDATSKKQESLFILLLCGIREFKSSVSLFRFQFAFCNSYFFFLGCRRRRRFFDSISGRQWQRYIDAAARFETAKLVPSIRAKTETMPLNWCCVCAPQIATKRAEDNEANVRTCKGPDYSHDLWGCRTLTRTKLKF